MSGTLERTGFAALVASALLAGCGGGAGSGEPAVAPSTELDTSDSDAIPVDEEAPVQVVAHEPPDKQRQPAVAEAAADADPNCCRGMNECKGLGGCKTDGLNDCAGMNECKGKGGCRAHCPN